MQIRRRELIKGRDNVAHECILKYRDVKVKLKFAEHRLHLIDSKRGCISSVENNRNDIVNEIMTLRQQYDDCKAVLIRYIDTIPNDRHQRDIISYNVIHGYSCHDIGDIVGYSASQVSRIIKRWTVE